MLVVTTKNSAITLYIIPFTATPAAIATSIIDIATTIITTLTVATTVIATIIIATAIIAPTGITTKWAPPTSLSLH